MEEGYIKYHLSWEKADALPSDLIRELNEWRSRMYDLGLIGYDPELKVGFGNISLRCPQEYGHFIISGTQTGHVARLDARHYTAVTAYDLARNTLSCKGPVKASSESLTHAALYACAESVQAVIHVHNRSMWNRLLHKVPTSSAEVPYGTPEMAFEVQRLFRESDLPHSKILVMAGHQDGILSFGESLEEAGGVLISL